MGGIFLKSGNSMGQKSIDGYYVKVKATVESIVYFSLHFLLLLYCQKLF